MINLKNIKQIYFVGIGGIGMSALAQYFYKKGLKVAGFDDCLTPLTDLLIQNGIKVSNQFNLPKQFLNPSKETLVVYTPAVNSNHKVLNYFIENKFLLIKRAKVLGLISKNVKTLAIAGTHGKTTTCSMLSHILIENNILCTAFIGGIAKNFKSNLVCKDDNLIIVEADEYDRSFLEISSDVAVITSLDSDHLDVYYTLNNLKNAFKEFIKKVKPNGILISNKNLNIKSDITYSTFDKATCFISNLNLQNNGLYSFSINLDENVLNNVEIPVFGKHNIANFLAALCVAHICGVNLKECVTAMQSYKGVERRFDVHLNKNNYVLIDDYAHHPVEIESTLKTAKELFAKQKIMCIFQPHLFSRTRDYAKKFGNALSQSDELIIIDIYPAREKPIKGVDATLILANASNRLKKHCSKNELLKEVNASKAEVYVMLGAGDISDLVIPVKEVLLEKLKAA